MSKFTEGKWILDGCNGHVVREATTEKPVAIVIGNSADPKQQAHARLITNAPEMYKFIESAFLTKDSRHLNWEVLVKSAGELLERIDGEEKLQA